MIEIIVANKRVIYLNHNKLIKSMYNSTTLNEGQTKYELRNELFYFDKRTTNPPHIQEDDTATELDKKPRKRKRKLTAISKSDPVGDLSQLETVVDRVIRALRTLGEWNSNAEPRVPAFPRCWEESHDFPQFHGANSTSEFKNFKLQCNTYIIPPNCRFFNYDIRKMPQLLPQLQSTFDLIVLDPPWRNKYIRRLKRVRKEWGYEALDNEHIQKLPLDELVHTDSIVAIWCTNAPGHQKTLINRILPTWNLRLMLTRKWLKVNTTGELICPVSACPEKKQPFEVLYIACHKDRPTTEDISSKLIDAEMLISVPSIIHSHKPPLLPLLRDVLPENPKCLELFARYLQPHFTSIGLEVLKLMDNRLYMKY